MAKKTARELKENRPVIDTAWRNAHNLVAGMNEIVEMRDVLATAKEAYDDLAALEELNDTQRTEAARLSNDIRAAQVELAGVKDHVQAAVDAERQRVLGELETRKKTLMTQITKLEEKSADAEKAHKDLVATLATAEKAAQERVTRLEEQVEKTRTEHAKILGQLRQLQASIPTGGG